MNESYLIYEKRKKNYEISYFSSTRHEKYFNLNLNINFRR